jgi:hypothetical protein
VRRDGKLLSRLLRAVFPTLKAALLSLSQPLSHLAIEFRYMLRVSKLARASKGPF